MSLRRKIICWAYAGIAVLALFATWRQNLAFFAESSLRVDQGFVPFWRALLVNRPAISITVDIFLFALAAFIWMLFESRRLGIRWVWLYLLVGIVIAISFAFPIFLIARERRLAIVDAERSDPPKLGAVDTLGLALFGMAIAAMSLWSIFR